MKVSIALEEGHRGGEMGEGQRKNYDNRLKGDGWRKRRGCWVKRMRGDLDKALDLMGAEEIKKEQVTLISIRLVSFGLISGGGGQIGEVQLAGGGRMNVEGDRRELGLPVGGVGKMDICRMNVEIHLYAIIVMM
jgi:hypothetical protein